MARVAITSAPTPFADQLAVGLGDRGHDVSLVSPGDGLPEVDAVVHADLVPASAESLPLVDLDGDGWEAAAEAPVRRAMAALQAAHATFQGRGGRVVVVTPTVGLVGAAGSVALATAVESVRGMAKGAARQWGPAGITVNFVAPALDRAGEAVAAVALLLGDDAAGVTGTTIGADGGEWVAP